MPHQVALTVRARIIPGHAERLKQLLDSIDRGKRSELLPFEEMAVHFARMFVIDDTPDPSGGVIPASLVFLSDVDSPALAYLEELADRCGDALDEIFAHCEGYPPGPGVTPAQRLEYLGRRILPSAAAYVNTIGRSVRQAHDEARLRDAIEDFLDRSNRDGSIRGLSPAEVRAAIQLFVSRDPDLRWALHPATPPEASWRFGETVHMIGIPLLLLLFFPISLALFPVWLFLLRRHEKRDIPDRIVPDPARIEELASREDFLVQNPFTVVGFIKPGPFRRLTLSSVMFLISYGVRHIFGRSDLAGVKTIHFARWVWLDGRRRMFFASNYDGSLESYMDDFIDKVAWGLNAAFSNGVGYPRTNWLIRDGAKDELAFKRLLRARQLDTQIWYTAYGDLTALNIANNAAIRAGLSGPMSPKAVVRWLGRL